MPVAARYEIKFVAYIDKIHEILTWINVHPAALIEPYPDRIVNNVYFDTFDYTAYSENLSGASSRTKVRYRWYGDSSLPDKGVLEIKRKRNFFGWKTYSKVNFAPCDGADSWKSIRNNILDQIDLTGKLWLQSNPFPIMINRYKRKYFVTVDGKIRVTVDTDQQVWDQRFKPYPNIKHRANLPDTFVMEVKFDRKDRVYASEFLQGIPLRVGRHSKYMNAVRACSGYR